MYGGVHGIRQVHIFRTTKYFFLICLKYVVKHYLVVRSKKHEHNIRTNERKKLFIKTVKICFELNFNKT